MLRVRVNFFFIAVVILACVCLSQSFHSVNTAASLLQNKYISVTSGYGRFTRGGRGTSRLLDKSAVEIEIDRKYLQGTELLLLTPLDLVSMEDVSALNKFFSTDTRKEMINAANLRLIVDGTPHVLVSNEVVSGLFYAIFIEKEKESQKGYESFMKWIRAVQSRGDEYGKITFFLSKRFHLIKVSE